MDKAKKVAVTVTYENETGEHEVTRHFKVTMGMVPPDHIFDGVKERVGFQVDEDSK